MTKRRLHHHHQRRHTIWRHLINFHYGHQTMLKSLLLFLVSLSLVSQICGFGYVVPEVIYAFENEVDHSIECTFDLKQGDGLTSKHLLFNETCDRLSWKTYDTTHKSVEILSKNKIRLKLPNLPYSRCEYTCQLGKSRVAFTSVIVGKRLGNVKDFSCRSKDWLNMTCAFKEMDNYIPLSYRLTYKLDRHRAGNYYNCPLHNDSKRGQYCDLYYKGETTSGNVEKFKADDYFYFTLESRYAEKTGLVGTNTENFEIDHLANVVPAAPTDLLVTNTTTDEATLTFKVPSHYKNTRISFDYEVQTKCQFDESWQSTNFTNIHPTTSELRVPLRYPFTEYDLRLRVKSHTAQNTEEMWSPFVTEKVKTLSRVPDRPPESTFGAFYIHDDDNLTIYWRHLEKYEENGPDFRYDIRGPKTKEITSISAQFPHLHLSSQEHYFEIFSSNINGTSLKPLKSHVPVKSELLDVQISLVQIFQRDEANKHNLTWTVKGTEEHLIDKFVMFSCISISGNPNTCDGQFSYVTVSKEKRWIMFDADPTLLYAIAAYAGERTTGMKWSECRSNPPNYIGKLLHAAIDRIDPYSLSINWKVDCPDKMVIQKFNITICEEPSSVKCHSLYPEKHVRSQFVQDLKPYTVYRVLVSMISTSGKNGAPFEVLEKTAETAPSAPRDLKYSNLTANSVKLSWTKPETINGLIRHHRIEFFSYEKDTETNETRFIAHKHEKNMEVNSTSYILDGLRSFTKYDVYLFACTVECSNKSSNIIKFQTEIGAPEMPLSLTVNDQMISWTEPNHFGGNLSFYEVKIESHSASEEASVVYRVKSTSCRIHSLCQKKKNEYKIFVRAVNVIDPDVYWESPDPDELRFCSEEDQDLSNLSDYQIIYGEWSSSPYNCWNLAAFNLSYILGMLFFLSIFLVGAFLIYRRLNECMNIEIDLPPGVKDINDVHIRSKTNLFIFQKLFSRDPMSAAQQDIVLVYGAQSPEEVTSNEQNEPLLPPLEDFRKKLPPIREMPERDMEKTQNKTKIAENLTPYVEMKPTKAPESFELMSPETPYLQMRPSPTSIPANLPPNNNYVQISKGITPTNYVKNVVQPNVRTSLKDEMLKISQEQQKPVMSGYVQPGFTGR
ncbi:cytokine receptor-like isoform X2 [Culicoides brevitarsis]|uniref:cytokine receptor-like isoform X2 n=1 Tax=Culicoides brevitarsis TaxID=469753 RepID=UPI00307BFEFE